MSFETCLAFTLLPENDGQSFHVTPGDSGGPTAYGITLAALSAYMGHACSANDLRHLSPVTRSHFYFMRQWVPICGDKLGAGLDLMAFDFGVLAGAETSAMVLQEALGVEPDHVIGAETLEAVGALTRVVLIDMMHFHQMRHLLSLPSWRLFGHGWQARADRRRARALEMVATAAIVA